MRNRRGFTMIEVVVALAVLAVPALVIMSYVQSNVAGAHFNQERLGANLILVDLAGLLTGERVEKLREVAAGDTQALDLMIEGRIAGLPEAHRDRYRAQVQPLFGKMRFVFEEDSGGIAGLSRLELKATLSHDAKVSLSWLLRPAGRVDLAAP